MKIATVGDLIDRLQEFGRDTPIALEDGEWGPLLCTSGIDVKFGEAQGHCWPNNRQDLPLGERNLLDYVLPGVVVVGWGREEEESVEVADIEKLGGRLG